MAMVCNKSNVLVHNQGKYIDRLVQERRNSSALAMELHISCSNPSILACDKINKENSVNLMNIWKWSATTWHNEETGFHKF